MILMIDNYDSFTYNLVQYLGELGAEVTVYRNDALGVDDIAGLKPAGIVLSPGPCSPAEAGISIETVTACAGRFPLLGVCLGHQAIAAAYGGRVVRAAEVMHGKTSEILHDGSGVFSGLPNPFEATRYHSLIVARSSLPAELAITAWTEDGTIMGLRHRELDVEGVQFHPESILTGSGKDLLANFLARTGRPEPVQA
ncbi:anthranilate synthase component II [Thiohalorhabdus sp.]|uniref:anthranilate synthase component II n=1 Tax=Thiohalorhabdus sp. TaxID=3094134 RepID=UPI002FC3ABA4